MARRFSRHYRVSAGALKVPQEPSNRTVGEILKSLAVVGVSGALIVAALAQTPVTDTSNVKSAAQIAIAIGWPVFVVVILLVLVLNAVMVAGETAVNLIRPMHVKHLREKSDKQANQLQILIDNKMSYAAACKLGSDLWRLLVFVLVLSVAPDVAKAAGYRAHFPTVLITALLLMIPVGLINLLFEMVPRSYAIVHPHGVAAKLYGIIRVTTVILTVPVKLATGLANLITARFGAQAHFAIANQAEEEIKTIAATAQESGEIEDDEKELLHSVFEFSDTVAREVMTPRVDIDALPLASTPQEVMALIEESGHSRIPLYEQTDDQIVGIVHAKDLFLAMLSDKDAVLKTLMRPAIFVPENKTLPELMAEMRNTRSQMMVVQDEFGGTAGIVTIEDIVEELVGDIVDEYDEEEPEITKLEDGWLADGKTHIDDLNDEIRSDFSTEEFDTVGGLVFGLFGRQPKQGEYVSENGYRFTVAETDGRRILKLKVERDLPEPELHPAE
ncbi:MAG TPA: hemolysin family protein [Fimbriimonadaceae bacterium]|jgi:putative hemolysin